MFGFRNGIYHYHIVMDCSNYNGLPVSVDLYVFFVFLLHYLLLCIDVVCEAYRSHGS